MPASEKPRIVKISSQMQVRIPRDMFERYGFGTEAEVVATETGIEFRPVKSADEKCGDILEALVDEGLSGEELVQRFRSEARAAASTISYAAVKL